MEYFDVIVIGGGPSGCYAALSAASGGLKVALFEEHHAIGWPRHDPGWLMESQFAESIIHSLGARITWRRVEEYRVCDAESGNIIEKSSPGGYLVRRDLLEKEIAALAVKAGAKLFLRTRVEKLETKNGKVEAALTNSQIIPRAEASVFICADGIRSSDNGLAVEQGICQKGQSKAGLSYLLANAEVSSGIVEHFLSHDPQLNYRCFFTHRKEASFLGVPSYDAFLQLRERTDNAVSRKIKAAYPIEINGYARAITGKDAAYFKKIVQGNLMFIGDSSGGSGNIHGMIQGHLAGITAASAIKDKDISEARLAEYQNAVSQTLGKAPFFYFSARQDFGSFNQWFREFESATQGIKAVELSKLM